MDKSCPPLIWFKTWSFQASMGVSSMLDRSWCSDLSKNSTRESLVWSWIDPNKLDQTTGLGSIQSLYNLTKMLGTAIKTSGSLLLGSGRSVDIWKLLLYLWFTVAMPPYLIYLLWVQNEVWIVLSDFQIPSWLSLSWFSTLWGSSSCLGQFFMEFEPDNLLDSNMTSYMS